MFQNIMRPDEEYTNYDEPQALMPSPSHDWKYIHPPCGQSHAKRNTGCVDEDVSPATQLQGDRGGRNCRVLGKEAAGNGPGALSCTTVLQTVSLNLKILKINEEKY